MILFRAEYKGATEHNGSRYVVHNLTQGTRHVVRYDHGAQSPWEAAVREVMKKEGYLFRELTCVACHLGGSSRSSIYHAIAQ